MQSFCVAICWDVKNPADRAMFASRLDSRASTVCTAVMIGSRSISRQDGVGLSGSARTAEGPNVNERARSAIGRPQESLAERERCLTRHHCTPVDTKAWNDGGEQATGSSAEVLDMRAPIRCKNWYSISRTVSDNSASRQHGCLLGPRLRLQAPRLRRAARRRWGLTARRDRANGATMPQMRT